MLGRCYLTFQFSNTTILTKTTFSINRLYWKISRNMANFAHFTWGGEDACIAILRHNFDYNQRQRPKHFDLGFPCVTRLAK